MAEDDFTSWDEARRSRALNPEAVARYRVLAEVESTLEGLAAQLAAVNGRLCVEVSFPDERIVLLGEDEGEK